MKEVNDSKFNMWRASMAVIYLDGKVTKEEEAWAESKINELPFSDAQREIIRNDLKSGLSIDTVLPLITHKPDIAFLLHLIRTIGHIDGCYDASEKEAFQKLEQRIMKGLDVESLEKQVRTMEEQSYIPKKEEIANKNSIIMRTINNFKWWLKI
ncbi:MAG: uncharacterized membrane protein YebE (DUF533 family) [Bacteriovoracaceae bacterium]|jgi:uncharacterized membrane protein YebE (DUF533 family)